MFERVRERVEGERKLSGWEEERKDFFGERGLNVKEMERERGRKRGDMGEDCGGGEENTKRGEGGKNKEFKVQ